MARKRHRHVNPTIAAAQSRYGADIVPVTTVETGSCPVADVDSLEALADVAKKYESVIMAADHAPHAAFLVWDNGLLFRYSTADPASADPISAESPAVSPSSAHQKKPRATKRTTRQR